MLAFLFKNKDVFLKYTIFLLTFLSKVFKNKAVFVDIVIVVYVSVLGEVYLLMTDEPSVTSPKGSLLKMLPSDR